MKHRSVLPACAALLRAGSVAVASEKIALVEHPTTLSLEEGMITVEGPSNPQMVIP